MDPSTGQIASGDKSLRVEPKVMDVLVFLARRPGKVVTRQELEAAVWSGRVVSYDALTGTMQKLRRAFGDDPRRPQIVETLSKKGYRLVAEVDWSGVPPAPQIAPHNPWPTGRRLLSALLLVLLAGTSMLLLLRPWEPAQAPPGSATGSAAIAVLPFDNLSGDPEQEYFADGITDDLITALARNPRLLVIARDSSFLYKGETHDLATIARNLDVRYLLHGSVRRAGDHLWLNAQLVDATTGRHLWADRYETDFGRLFALQDGIADQIGFALGAPQPRSEHRDREPASSEAYDLFLHGRNRFFLYASKKDNQKARELYQKAIDLDPELATAYAMLAWTHAFDAMNGWSDDRDLSLRTAQRFADTAVELEPGLPVAYFVTGLVYREQGDYAKALVEARKAIVLDPSYANAHVLLATLLYYTGRPQEGLARIRQAMLLNPHHPYNYPFHLGQANFILERYPEAIEAFEQGLESNPDSERLRVWLAAAYAQAGRDEDARWEVEQVRAVNPDFSLDRISRAFPFKQPGDLERFLDGLRKAGLSP